MDTALSEKNNYIWGIVCLFVVVTIFTQDSGIGISVGGVHVTVSLMSAVIYCAIAAYLLYRE